MRLIKCPSGLIFDLSKLSAMQISEHENRLYVVVDGQKLIAKSNVDAEFVEELIEVWGDDESGANDSPAAVD